MWPINSVEVNLVKNNTETIRLALAENRHGERDDDIQLIVSVLIRLGIIPEHITLAQYLQKMKTGELPWLESITRIRRQLQRLDKSLEGANQGVRRQYRSFKVKQELGEIFDEQTGQGVMNFHHQSRE